MLRSSRPPRASRTSQRAEDRHTEAVSGESCRRTWRIDTPTSGILGWLGRSNNLSPRDYLNRLADAAAEWFEQRPEGPVALARRGAEFRQGCSVRIFAEHRPLAAEDRRWLVERCRAWAAELDRSLEALDAGRAPRQVREDVDGTVTRLSAALRTRAEGTQAG